MRSYRAVVETAQQLEDPLTEPLEVVFRDTRRGLGHRFTLDEFTGGHLLHLAVAGCVFNDLLRESRARGITLTRVSVAADGGFQGSPCESTGVDYEIAIEGDADAQQLHDLVAYVETIAEIPAVIRQGAEVRLAAADVKVANKLGNAGNEAPSAR